MKNNSNVWTGVPVDYTDFKDDYNAHKENHVNVKQFGAKGDGVTDDMASVQTAIDFVTALGGGAVYFPAGSYLISANPSIPKSIKLRGVGSGGQAMPTAVPASVISRLIVPAGISLPALNAGFEMSDLMIDGNNAAAVCIQTDGMTDGLFKNLYVTGFTSKGVYLYPDNETFSFNTFINLHINGNAENMIGLQLSGGGYNACHNTFINTRIEYAGVNATGIQLDYCDNNSFHMTYLWCSAAKKAGVYCDSTIHAGFPINNTFYHLQASVSGWLQDAGTQKNQVYGYMKDNGQPDPVNMAGGLPLWWTGSDGVVLPYARVYNSAAISLTTGTQTILTFDTESENLLDIHKAANPSRLSIPCTGLYLIQGRAAFALNATGTRTLEIIYNNNLPNPYARVAVPASSTKATEVEVNLLMRFSRGDYLELAATQDSGGALDVLRTVQHSPFFSLVKLS